MVVLVVVVRGAVRGGVEDAAAFDDVGATVEVVDVDVDVLAGDRLSAWRDPPPHAASVTGTSRERTAVVRRTLLVSTAWTCV